jgi:hypothetical protein
VVVVVVLLLTLQPLLAHAVGREGEERVLLLVLLPVAAAGADALMGVVW